MIHYPNKIRSHLVTNVPMAPFTPKSTSKLRSALHFRYSIVIPRFIPRANTFDYHHFTYGDYLLCTITASAHIIHYVNYSLC